MLKSLEMEVEEKFYPKLCYYRIPRDYCSLCKTSLTKHYA